MGLGWSTFTHAASDVGHLAEHGLSDLGSLAGKGISWVENEGFKLEAGLAKELAAAMGHPLPDADPNALYQAAGHWSQLGTTLSNTQSASTNAVNALTANNSGTAIDGFSTYMFASVLGPVGGSIDQKPTLGNLVTWCNQMSEGCTQYGQKTEETTAAIVEKINEALAELAVTVLVAFATSGLVAPLAEALAERVGADLVILGEDLASCLAKLASGLFKGFIAGAANVDTESAFDFATGQPLPTDGEIGTTLLEGTLSGGTSEVFGSMVSDFMSDASGTEPELASVAEMSTASMDDPPLPVTAQINDLPAPSVAKVTVDPEPLPNGGASTVPVESASGTSEETLTSPGSAGDPQPAEPPSSGMDSEAHAQEASSTESAETEAGEAEDKELGEPTEFVIQFASNMYAQKVVENKAEPVNAAKDAGADVLAEWALGK